MTTKFPCPRRLTRPASWRRKVKADFGLGEQIGLKYTPTIFVVGRDNAVTPFVEVGDRNQLSQIIADMLKKAPTPPATPVKTKTKTAASKKKSS